MNRTTLIGSIFAAMLGWIGCGNDTCGLEEQPCCANQSCGQGLSCTQGTCRLDPLPTCEGPASEICGNCGERTRTCNNGMWSSWGQCLHQGSCYPGEEQACAGGGKKICSNVCTWGTCQGSSCLVLPGSGTYTVTQSVKICPGTYNVGLDIAAKNIVVDGQGSTIKDNLRFSYPSSGSDEIKNIVVGGSTSVDTDNNYIHDVRLYSLYLRGYGNSVRYATIVVPFPQNAVLIFGSSHTIADSTIMGGGGTGYSDAILAFVQGASNNKILRTTITIDPKQWGIQINGGGQGNLLDDNTVSGAKYGLMWGNGTIVGNVITNNNFSGCVTPYFGPKSGDGNTYSGNMPAVQ